MTPREPHTTQDGSSNAEAARSPIERPISRRRALVVLGAGAVAAGGGLGTILAGCGPSLPDYPVWATLGIDPEALPVNEPMNVPFTATWESGSLDTSTWLVKNEDGTLTAYNPFCTHAACEYDWADGTDQFVCACHDAAFALDGTVLTGPPPRPLDRWALRSSAGGVEVEITGQVAPSPTAG